VESIGRFVLEQLAAWAVPGCAVAVVRDGAVARLVAQPLVIFYPR
jgi:hypothetical protein